MTSRPVRALVISRIHLPESSAASFRLDAVERALVREGAHVRVLTTTVPSQEPSDPEGVHVSRWPALRDASGYLRGYVPYMSFDLPLLWRLLVAPRADIALVEPPPTTGVVARCILSLRRIPYVWYAPDIWSDATEATSAPQLVKRVVRAMESFAMRGARAVVAINEDVAQRVRTLGGRAVHVVLNGIDTTLFTVDGDEPDPKTVSETGVTGPYFVYAGTASEWQGADVFVRALAHVRQDYPDVHVLFLGQGSDWERLAELARSIPGTDPVLFRSSVPPAEAAAWQRGAVAALVSIKPRIGYDFAYPTKVLASLACGTPVIYAGVGPATSDIHEANLGWVCAHDADEVAAAMREALEGRERKKKEGTRLHAWVDTHRSIRATGQAVARILMRCVSASLSRKDEADT